MHFDPNNITPASPLVINFNFVRVTTEKPNRFCANRRNMIINYMPLN